MDKIYYRMHIDDDSDPRETADGIPGAKVYHNAVYLPESFVLSDDPLVKQMEECGMIDKRPVKESSLNDSRIDFDQLTDFYMDKYDVDDSRLLQWSKNMASWMAGKAEAAKEELNAAMTSKMEVVGTVIESKLLIYERMLGYIDDSEFAGRLAEDANVRKTVNLLCQQVLQPTPVVSLPETKNSFINLGGGVSAFWNEMQKKLPIEVDNVAEIENILMNVNAGLDKNMEPDTRKKFLMEAGLTEEQVKEFVTDADYAEYEEKAREIVRRKVMEDLGIQPGDELSDAELIAIDSMTEERMMGAKMQITLDNYELTFEDVYGISAQDMYELFGDAGLSQPMPPESSMPENDMDLFMEASNAKVGYFDILNGALDENLALFEELRQQELNDDLGLSLTEEDLQSLSEAAGKETQAMPEPSGYPGFGPGITDADLAFAEQYTEEDYESMGQ